MYIILHEINFSFLMKKITKTGENLYSNILASLTIIQHVWSCSYKEHDFSHLNLKLKKKNKKGKRKMQEINN